MGLFGAAVITLTLALAPTSSRSAMVFSWEVMQPQWVRGDTLIKDMFEPPQIYLGRAMAASERLEYYLPRLMLDESWEQWLAFQRYPYRVIPITALKRIFRVAYVSTKLQQVSSEEQDPDKVLDVARSIILPGEATWITSRKGLINYTGDTRKFSPFELLTQEEGLFSGRPWDWENFLPRLLIIGGLVLLGLLVTEGLHALFGLGAKVMGLRKHNDSTESS